MSNIRAKFTKNAEEFDGLVMEMLTENEGLKERIAELEKQLGEQLNDCVCFGGSKLSSEIMERSSKLLNPAPKE